MAFEYKSFALCFTTEWPCGSMKKHFLLVYKQDIIEFEKAFPTTPAHSTLAAWWAAKKLMDQRDAARVVEALIKLKEGDMNV